MLYFIYICLSIYLVTKSDHTGQLFPLGGFVFFCSHYLLKFLTKCITLFIVTLKELFVDNVSDKIMNLKLEGQQLVHCCPPWSVCALEINLNKEVQTVKSQNNTTQFTDGVSSGLNTDVSFRAEAVFFCSMEFGAEVLGLQTGFSLIVSFS